jgi:putative transposase
MMRVGASAYYRYALGKTYRETIAQQKCREKVRTCFYEHRRRYGSRRIAAELKIGRFKARSAMKQAGLQAIAPKRFKPVTTDSSHDSRISPHLLQNGMNAPTAKGQVIVGDITYLPLRNGGFCYLACFQDKYTRRIISWQVSNLMTRQLVLDALNQGLRRGLIRRGAIIHTDRGSHYASAEYRRLLYINGFRQSMSRKGNCYDNAQAESFFSRFKAELVENGVFESVADAKSEVFSYIEGYYNRIRLHSSLGYKSPMQFEKHLELENKIRSSESFVCGKT